MVRLFPFLIALFFFGCSQTPKIVTVDVESPTANLLQAISFTKDAIWVSGHVSTFCRSLDGGETWEVFHHTKLDSLQFRDIHAFSKDRITLMSAGPGELSRIFLFDASDQTWNEVYKMPHPEGFLNTIEFWDDHTGLAFGDSFFGQHFLLKTTDGGQIWNRIEPSLLPIAGEGEGGFAASGTCISLLPDGQAWIVTGAGGYSHILYSADFGESWTSTESPLVKGPAAGITSIRMQPNGVGIIVGGDLAKPDGFTTNTAFTEDYGVSWQLKGFPVTMGAFYGSSLVNWKGKSLSFACGPNGLDYSMDMGAIWENLSQENYWAVAFRDENMGLAVGKNGRILKIVIE